MIGHIKDFWALITYPYRDWKRRKELKKRIEELRKRDPFIYK
jgi:hypothetical protein